MLPRKQRANRPIPDTDFIFYKEKNNEKEDFRKDPLWDHRHGSRRTAYFDGHFFVSGNFGHTASYGLSGDEWINNDVDKGYTSFNGDAYTFMNNNMALAAEKAYSINKNAQEIGNILNSAIGMFFIAFGLLSICYFGMQLAKEEKCNAGCAPKEKNEAAPETEVTADTVTDEN